MDWITALSKIQAHQQNRRTRTEWPKISYATHLEILNPEANYADPIIGLRHHQTIIAEWRPDGTFVVDTQGWNTVTTFRKLDEFAPQGLRFMWRKRGCVWTDQTYPHRCHHNLLDGPNTFKQNYLGFWVNVNAPR